MEKIGFIGLGIMGKPMSLNLLKAGFEVIVYNRTQKKADELVKAGASSAKTPAEVANNSDIIITIVSDTPDVEEVILGKTGIINGIKKGGVVIDMSTISPAVTINISEALHQKGAEMLDAPVSGGDTGAINGTLAIMVGGKEDVFNRCFPVFEAMGKTITYVGGNGMGQTTKLCNQILVTVTNMAVSEAVLFAQKAGLDADIMIEATKGGAAGSWQLANLGTKMNSEDFAPGFMIDLQQKDLRLVLEMARDNKLPLPATAMVNKLFAGKQNSGEGKLGTQALIKSIKKIGQ
jgi:3-hydroxyisobutyrate dehydrogenase